MDTMKLLKYVLIYIFNAPPLTIVLSSHYELNVDEESSKGGNVSMKNQASKYKNDIF
jgi:hypothetical protein